jgi:hypothetical protein
MGKERELRTILVYFKLMLVALTNMDDVNSANLPAFETTFYIIFRAVITLTC